MNGHGDIYHYFWLGTWRSLKITVVPNQWNHVAVTYKDGEGIRGYLNGSLVNTANFTGDLTSTTSPLRIGSNSPVLGSYFNGAIDEVRIWNKSKTASEIGAQKDVCLSGSESGLIAYYSFNEGTGTTTTDASVNSSNGTLNNMAADDWVTSNPNVKGKGDNLVAISITDSSGNKTTKNATVYVLDTIKPAIQGIRDTTIYVNAAGSASLTAASLYSGVTDNCSSTFTVIASDTSFSCSDAKDTVLTPSIGLDFDGSNDQVNLGNSILVGSNNFTWEAWVNPKALSANTTQSLITKDAAGSIPQCRLDILGSQFKFILGSSSAQILSNQTLSTNTWYHVAAVRDGATHYLYVNGVLDTVLNTGSVQNHTYNSHPVIIGSRNNSGTAGVYFEGKMDEVRLWSVARSASEIKANYKKALSGSETGLVSYLDFEDGTGTTATDKSGNGKNGTLENMDNSDWVTGHPFETVGVPVYLETEDASGNKAYDTVYVNFVDTTAPILTIQNTTVYLDSTGTASVQLSALYSSVTDNCAIGTVAISSDSTFTCSDITETGGTYIPSHYYFRNGSGVFTEGITSGTNLTSLFNPNRASWAIEYDANIDKVFYVDGNGHTLIKADRNGSNQTTLASSLGIVYGIRVDPTQQVVYFVEANGAKRILKVNYDGTGLTTLGTSTYAMGGLHLDKANEVLYYSNWASNGKIGKINTDGTGQVDTYINTGTTSLFGGVYYMTSTNTLYWSVYNSTNAGSIMKKVGSGSPAVAFSGYSNLFGFEIDEANSKIYFVKYGGQQLIVSDLDGSNATTLASGLGGNTYHVSLARGIAGGAGTAVSILATDASGNTTSDTAYVTVLDTIAPNVIASNDTVFLNENGMVLLDSINVVSGGITGSNVWDNCAVAYLTYSQDSLTASHLGANNIAVTVTDSSGNSYTDSVIVFVKDRLAPFAGLGNTLEFDGVNDYVKATGTLVQPTTALTIETWVKPSFKALNYQGIVDNSVWDGTNRQGFFLYLNADGSFRGMVGAAATGSNADVASSSNINTNGWNHVAMTYDQSYLRLFINGEIVDSSAYSQPLGYSGVGNSYGLNIGRFHDATENVRFEGKIADVGIWNIAKSNAQITADYRRVINANESGLIAYYNFNHLSGLSLNDLSSSNADGVLNNMSGNEWIDANDTLTWEVFENNAIGDTAAFAMGWDQYLPEDSIRFEPVSGFSTDFMLDAVSGAITMNKQLNYELDSVYLLSYAVKDLSNNRDTAQLKIKVLNDPTERTYAGLGNSLEFGINDYVSVPHSSSLNISGPFTVAMWLKTSGTGNDIILEKNGNSGFSVQRFSSNQWGINVNNGFITASADASKNDGKWHHLAFVYNGANDGYVYVDGEDVTVTNTPNTPNLSSGILAIGSRSGTLGFEGDLDEVQIWSRALNASELSLSYAGLVDVSDSDLVAYYNFNEVDLVEQLVDLSGNQNNGTLTNMTYNEWRDAADTIDFYVYENINIINSNYLDQSGDTIGWMIGSDGDGETLKYKAFGSLSTAFSYDSISGAIRVVDQTFLDFETQSEYLVNYYTEGNLEGLRDTAILRINVRDLYEPPIVNLPIVETFDGTTSNGWTYSGNNGGNFRPADWLRLTDNGNGRFGIAFYDTAFYANKGIHVEFDYASYGGTGADGFVFFLFDGYAGDPTPGASGGALGYSPSSTEKGLDNAYLGVAFDE